MYDIKISGQKAEGIPELQAQFGRVTVILGANGTGKSRLLVFLRDHRRDAFGGDRPIIYVEGGRAVVIPEQIKSDFTDIRLFETHKQALKEHTAKRHLHLTSRIKDAIMVLIRRGEEDKAKHSDAVDRWIKAGKPGDCPERSEPPLDRLFRLFNEALPSIHLAYDHPHLYARKGDGRQYAAHRMSDGEKQVFALLADIAMLAEENSLILVDEPELNLHPNLASQLWSTIEADRPECVFVYATHSISFAMRSSVEQALILASTGQALELKDPTTANSGELRPFLGAIPAILRSDRTLVVEGEDASSFDAPFYRWILAEPTVEVVSLGGCEQVVAATTRTGLWERVAIECKILGIVDRDFRPDNYVTILSGGSCRVLDLHEAESYLCHPDLLVELAAKLRIVTPIPKREALVESLINFGREHLVRTAATRASARASLNLGVSVPRQALAVADAAKAIDLLRKAASVEAKKANLIGEDEIEKMFNEEQKRCAKALDNLAIDQILRIFPGKEIASQLARIIGLRDIYQLALAARNHLSPDDFPHTKTLRALLQWTQS